MQILQLWLFGWGALSVAVVARLPIVYVFTIVPAICKNGFPEYISYSLRQAVLTQPDAEVVLVSNFAECPRIESQSMPGITKVDSCSLTSNRTKNFLRLSPNVFQTDNKGELWITSALRFFILEDVARHLGYHELLHVEADNMLYGNITSLLPMLRRNYAGLAATPLTYNITFITASVFWVSDIKYLTEFNDVLLGIVSTAEQPEGMWKQYLTWIRPYACCKHGGTDQDSKGMGVRPHSINEMSMMAFYHSIKPDVFHLLPVLPRLHNDVPQFLRDFGTGGAMVGRATLSGVWDANSWGQHIGGTHQKGGRNIGYVDSSHIVGMAILDGRYKAEISKAATGVEVVMRCSSLAYSATFGSTLLANSSDSCVTSMHVRLGASYPWTPLWNLHVHSKHTARFRSLPCTCE